MIEKKLQNTFTIERRFRILKTTFLVSQRTIINDCAKLFSTYRAIQRGIKVCLLVIWDPPSLDFRRQPPPLPNHWPELVLER